MSRAPLTITSDKHPFEIGCFACAVSVGAWGLLVPDGISKAIADAIYPWAVDAYYAFMTTWGLAALIIIGVVTDQDLRIRLIRCALYGVGYGALAYAVAAIVTTGPSAGTAAMPWLWVSIVCTWRIVQIAVERRKLRRALAEPHLADPPPLGCPDNRSVASDRAGREG